MRTGGVAGRVRFADTGRSIRENQRPTVANALGAL